MDADVEQSDHVRVGQLSGEFQLLPEILVRLRIVSGVGEDFERDCLTELEVSRSKNCEVSRSKNCPQGALPKLLLQPIATRDGVMCDLRQRNRRRSRITCHRGLKLPKFPTFGVGERHLE
jgi:hypothetical protein